MLTFNGILKLCAEQNAKQEAVRTFKRLQKAAVDADDDSYKLLLQCTAAFQRFLCSSLFDQDSTHCFSCRSEEMAATLPILVFAAVEQT